MYIVRFMSPCAMIMTKVRVDFQIPQSNSPFHLLFSDRKNFISICILYPIKTAQETVFETLMPFPFLYCVCSCFGNHFQVLYNE